MESGDTVGFLEIFGNLSCCKNARTGRGGSRGIVRSANPPPLLDLAASEYGSSSACLSAASTAKSGNSRGHFNASSPTVTPLAYPAQCEPCVQAVII